MQKIFISVVAGFYAIASLAFGASAQSVRFQDRENFRIMALQTILSIDAVPSDTIFVLDPYADQSLFSDSTVLPITGPYGTKSVLYLPNTLTSDCWDEAIYYRGYFFQLGHFQPSALAQFYVWFAG